MENILEILKQQHRDLRKQLEEATEESKSEKPNGVAISQKLSEFNKLLKAHLIIEDEIFYPQILEKMRKKNIQTAGTEEFIKHMVVIAEEVYAFLDKYKEPASVENSPSIFKQELKEITSALILRVTSEEDGVYMYWSL